MIEPGKQWDLGELLDFELRAAPKSLVALGHPPDRIEPREVYGTVVVPDEHVPEGIAAVLDGEVVGSVIGDLKVEVPFAACPSCGAIKGPCRTRRGHRRHDHRSRMRAWVVLHRVKLTTAEEAT